MKSCIIILNLLLEIQNKHMPYSIFFVKLVTKQHFTQNKVKHKYMSKIQDYFWYWNALLYTINGRWNNWQEQLVLVLHWMNDILEVREYFIGVYRVYLL